MKTQYSVAVMKNFVNGGAICSVGCCCNQAKYKITTEFTDMTSDDFYLCEEDFQALRETFSHYEKASKFLKGFEIIKPEIVVEEVANVEPVNEPVNDANEEAIEELSNKCQNASTNEEIAEAISIVESLSEEDTKKLATKLKIKGASATGHDKLVEKIKAIIND